MSEATFRHVNALTAKYELLREVKHWKRSCNTCIKEVTVGLTELRESRAAIKRQINATRAELEERLRELEQLAEKQLYSLVTLEEEAMKNFIKNLNEKKKKLESTESALKENIIGVKLKRTIEDGRDLTLSTRQSLVQMQKYDMATHVEFALSAKLVPIIDSIQSFGILSLKAPYSDKTVKGRKQGEAENGHDTTSSLGGNLSSSAIGGNMACSTEDGSGILSETFDERDVVRDMDKLFGLDLKYEHSLKPFLDTVKDMSLKFNNSQVKKANQNISRSANGSILVNCEQVKGSSLRPCSALNTKRANSSNVSTRLSKSAREDGRRATNGENNTCLNDIDMSYVPFEEQGPERATFARTKDKNLSVRYHDFDFIKEITAISDHGDSVGRAACLPSGLLNGHQSESLASSRTQSPGSQSSANTSLSSVSYKPSNSLASAPVYISASELKKSKSYFNYIARFHTKKHPDETDLCRLAGIVALDNGQIIVSDINHLQVMLFGPDFHYLDALECPSPGGITIVDQNIVAVTLFHNRKIMLINVHTIHLERYREFHIDCPDALFDVVYRGNLFYVLCRAGEVHVLDDEGKQTAMMDTRCQGCEARHIEVDPELRLIYVSGSDRVVAFNEEGDVVWQYCRTFKQRRFTPGGLLLYNNRLFIADWCTHKILELSTDGTYVRDVVNDNIEYPQAIAIQQTTGRMFITQNNLFKQEARSRSIKVFEAK